MGRMATWDDLRHSAEQGDCVAAFRLAMGHASGSGGLTVDLVRAHCWFNVAGACGHRAAQDMRTEIACEMSAKDVAQAQRMARTTLRSLHA